MDPKFIKKLFDATDLHKQLLLRPDDIQLKQFQELLRDLCSALTQALEHGLREAIIAVGQRANDPDVVMAAKEILTDFRTFANFTEFQAEHLRSFGVSGDETARVNDAVSFFRRQLVGQDFNTKDVIARAERFQKETCHTAAQVKNIYDYVQGTHDFDSFFLQTWGYGLIAAGGTITVATAGAGAIIGAPMGVIGGALTAFEKLFLKSPSTMTLKKWAKKH